MNPDQPAREEIEAKLTALLLGELPEEEAKLLRWAIAQDPGLEKLHDRLKLTIALVREVASHQTESNPAENDALKLSETRRQELLALFKTPRTKPLFWLKRIDVPTLVIALGLLAIAAMLAAIILPNFVRARNTSESNAALNQLRQLDAEKEQLALENKKTPPAATAAGLPGENRDFQLPAQAATVNFTLNPVTTIPQKPKTEIVLPQPQPASMPSFAFGGSGGGGIGGAAIPNLSPPPPPAFSSLGNSASLSGEIGGPAAPVASGASTFAQRLNSVAERRPVGGLGGLGGRQDRNANQDLADNFDAGLQQAESPQAHFGPEGGSFQQKRFSTLAPRVSPPKDNLAYGYNFPSEKVPVLGDLPALGNTFKSHGGATQSPRIDANTGLPVAAPPFSAGSAIASNGGEPATGLPPGLVGNIGGSLAPIAEQPKEERPPAQVPAMPTTPPPLARDQFVTTYPLVIPRGGQMNAPAINQTGASVATNAAPIATSEASAPTAVDEDRLIEKSPPPAPVFTPEIQTSSNTFSTFSMNVSDVSFKLAEASLQNGRLPDAASIRSEEFINAFDYRDPEALPGVAVAFTSERARDPFAQNCDLLRFSLKTVASGRAADRPLNLVLLLDNSGSMERADRVAIIRAALRVLGAQLHPQDTVSVVTFARTARLWVDGVPGDQAGAIFDEVGGLTPQGGTNLEEAMRLAYATARRHYLANGMNRVVLLTDGAANLGNVDPNALKQKVETNRRQGIALDCFGIGWEDYNDDLLELLSSNGDGRYAFLNSPDDVSSEFAAKLAGALQVAAEDVKVQVEFNPERVTAWRQIGYASHQLTQEQFRDNTVAAGAIAAREAGNALYTVRVNPQGDGPLATVRVRYKIPGTTEVREQAWDVAYTGGAVSLEQSSAAMRLAAVAGEFAEWLAASPSAQEVTPDELLGYLSGTPETYGADPRPKQLEWMIRQAQSLSGK